MPSGVSGRCESSGQLAGSTLGGDRVTHEVQLHGREVCLSRELAARDGFQNFARDLRMVLDELPELGARHHE